MWRLIFFGLLLPIFTGAQTTPASQNSLALYPDSTWERIINPNNYGWDNTKLRQLRSYIIDSTHTTGMVVIQSGRILFEYGDIQELSYLASCRKSILSMLYGPFVENGTIDLNTSIEQLKLDDVGGLLPIEKKAIVKDLLTARSGACRMINT